MSQYRNQAGRALRRAVRAATVECAAVGIDADYRPRAGGDGGLRILPGVAAQVEEPGRAMFSDELPGDIHLSLSGRIVMGVLSGVFLPIGSASALQPADMLAQAIGERDQIPARDRAPAAPRVRLYRRGLNFLHCPSLDVDVHQHVRAEPR